MNSFRTTVKTVLGTLLLSAIIAAPSVALASASGQELNSLLQMADYIGVDYPEFVQNGQVLNAQEYAEQKEFAGNILTLALQLPEAGEKSTIVAKAQALQEAVAAKAPGEQIRALSGDISRLVMAAYQVEVAPRTVPNLAEGERLYQESCAGCHGAEGRGDGPTAAGLEPPPTDFHDRERAAQRSVYALYNTLSLGIAGTAMPSFSQLSDAQRWELAFYVSQLQYSPAELEAGRSAWQQGDAAFRDLSDVAAAVPAQVAATAGEQATAALAYLRTNPQAVAQGESDALAFALARLRESVQAHRSGDYRTARQLALTAYLEGFEIAEATLAAVSPEMVKRIEAQMLSFRQAIDQRAPAEQLDAQLSAIQQSFVTANQALSGDGLSVVGSFLGSFVILAREGLEAILVLAAIFAFLNKANRPDARRYVHVGWISALLLGVATWFVSTYVVAISGASREATEGVSALLAAGILLYVGYWMHSKSYSSTWQKFVADKVHAAIGKRNLWLLALLAFIAVYREAFETVLFYRAIWAQGDHVAIIAGFAAAAVVLVVISWAIFALSVRLPIGRFFSWSSVLIAVLAVIFAGNGIAALQEAGLVPIDPVPFVSVPLLGIHGNIEALLAQLAVLMLFVLAFGFNHMRARRLAEAS